MFSSCACVHACAHLRMWLHTHIKCLKGLTPSDWEWLPLGVSSSINFLLYYKMFSLLDYYFFRLKKEKEKKTFCLSHCLLSKDFLNTTDQHWHICLHPLPTSWRYHIVQNGQSHLIPPDSNPSRDTFHSRWARENEFDKVPVSNFVASKLRPMFSSFISL